MSKARNIADLLGADGDIKADRLDSHGAKKDFSNVGSLPASVRLQLKGDTGNTGATGAQGLQGITGATGAAGPAGSNGTIGVDGATGATGPAGSNGTSGSDASFPTGVITMWAGTNAAIPSGWALCNGSNGTPDLRNRFVVGSGSGYATGNTGGADSVTASGSVNVSGLAAGSHTLSTAQMPSHSHYQRRWRGGSGNSNLYKTGDGQDTHTQNGLTQGSRPTPTSGSGSNHSHSHSMSGSASFSGSSHNNRPQYYAIAYIMKL